MPIETIEKVVKKTEDIVAITRKYKHSFTDENGNEKTEIFTATVYYPADFLKTPQAK